MIVVTLTDCPPRLRGDLSKWLLEISTGVYVGQLSKRVREELWKRICDNLPRGRATRCILPTMSSIWNFFCTTPSGRARILRG